MSTAKKEKKTKELVVDDTERKDSQQIAQDVETVTAGSEATVSDSTTSTSSTDGTHSEIVAKQTFLRRSLKALARRKKTLIAVFLLIVIFTSGLLLPKSRYWFLNTIGSADATIIVTSSSTNLPLSGATVTLSSGMSVETNDEGVAFFNDADYGKTSATISKSAYETTTVDIEIKSDNAQVGSFPIKPTGIPVKVTLVDWLSKQPINDFVLTASSDGSIFKSENGQAVVNIPTEATESQNYIASTNGYNDTEVTIYLSGIERNPDSVDAATKFEFSATTAGKHFFVSNRDGKVGFYNSNYDGSNVEKLVSTDQDGEYFSYYAIPDSDNAYVAFMKSSEGKDGKHDQLAVIKPTEKSLEIVDEVKGADLDFSLIDVSKDRIVYSVYYDDEKADRYKIKSYSFADGQLKTHYTDSQYQSVVYDEVRDNMYIAESRKYYPYEADYSRTLLKINLATDKREIVLSSTTVHSLQIPLSKPDKLFYGVSSNYYGENTTTPGYYFMDLVDSSKVESLGEDYPDLEEPDDKPDSEKGQASPNGTNRVWVETRDGKGRLIVNETSNLLTGEADSLSVYSIIRWVSEDRLTVTGSDGNEVADFVVDIKTGNYRKITNTFRSYYGHGY